MSGQRQIVDKTEGEVKRLDKRPFGDKQEYPYFLVNYVPGGGAPTTSHGNGPTAVRGEVFDPERHGFIENPMLRKCAGFETVVVMASGRNVDNTYRDSLTIGGAWSAARIIRMLRGGKDTANGWTLAGHWKTDPYVEVQSITIVKR